MRTSSLSRPFGACALPARALALLGVSMLALTAQPGAAQSPEGGKVVKGSAKISQSGARTTVRQSSERAVIDWRGFDVGRGNSVDFDQPGRNSATLNRITSGRGSVIEGAIRAPGTVIIQNSAGVLFSKGSKVDVGGLVATSQGIDADRFQRDGGLRIGGGERAGARIVNQGDITIGEAGLAALVGSDVENDGVILARRGTVALASGTRTTIDLTGDGMVRIAVDGDPSGGSRIVNGGMIDAGGGRVLLSAGGASSALDNAINTTGVIRATSRSGDGGTVELVGRGQGKVRVSGTIDTSGARNGGSVTVTGQVVAVTNASVSARGGSDGGDIRIGGDRQGAGPLRRADHLHIAADVTIAADGGTGAGGRVIAWSDDATRMDGDISATGGTSGGFVETSGRFDLAIGEGATVSLGGGGAWLLDPRNVSIIRPDGSNVSAGVTNPPNGSGAYTVNADSIEAALNGGGDVTITTEQARRDDLGDILVLSPLSWTGAGALRLVADEDVTIRERITTERGDFFAIADDDVEIEAPVTSTGSADLVFRTLGITPFAGSQIRIYDNVIASGTGSIKVDARKGPVRFLGNASTNLIMRTAGGDLSISAASADRPSDQWDFGVVIAERESDLSGSNIQIHSGSGAVDISADSRIELNGGDGRSGKWVRVGRTDSSSDVTLTAPEINISGGNRTNNFAEAVAGGGGSLSLRADAITLRSDAGFARALAQSGSGLSMLAETQTWDGRVEAGTDPVTGGETEISGAITATVQPRFSLTEDRNFVMGATTPRGAPSSYSSDLPLAVETSGAGTIDVGGKVTARQVTLLSEARVGIGAGAGVTGTGPDDAVIISAGANFRNEAGPGSVRASDPGARWLVYINGFSGLDGDAPGPRGYDLYNRFYDLNLPDSLGDFDGNRIVYGQQPVLTITADMLAKTYGQTATPGFTIGALRPGDTAAIALDGAPSADSAGSPADADAGSYATFVSARASDQGYRLDLVPGTLTVNAAALTITANDAARSYGGADPAFTATYDGLVLGQGPDALTGDLGFTTDATRTSGVGAYALTPGGQTSGNYAITFAPGAFDITPAALTVTPEGTRTYGGLDTVYSPTFTGFVLGEGPGDLDGTLIHDTDATIDSDAGTYALTATGGQTSGNYAITYAPGAFDITPAALTVTPEGARTYGSLDTVYSPTFTGFVLGEGPGDLDGTLIHDTDATIDSDAGTYALTATGLSDPNYAITFADGALEIGRAALRVRADDATRIAGQPDPDFTATYDGFVLGQNPGTLDGDLAFRTPATAQSPAGRYTLTPGGQTGRNYDIAWIDGTLAVRPAGPLPPVPPLPPQPPVPPVPPVATGLTPLNDLTREFGRGVPPLTPGDASFRTTVTEAPPAIDSPFALTYSLGEIVQLAPQGAQAANTGGFVPASGGFVPASGEIADAGAAAASDPSCAGPINRGDDATCDRLTATENFWTSTAEGTP